MEAKARIALLIDADNVSARRIDLILNELSGYGETSIRRAYGNWTKSELRGWAGVLHENAIRPMQQYDYSSGKNASDMALVVDAMALLYTDRPEAYAEALDRWLAYYRELGIERVGYACVVMRKREDGRDGWIEALQLPRAALRPAGRHVERLFDVRDRRSEIGSDNGLLESRLCVVDDAVVAQDTRFTAGGWQPEALTLRLENGLPFSAELDRPTARLIRALDGSRTLDAALAAAALDGAAERETGLALARRMLEVGFLELRD